MTMADTECRYQGDRAEALASFLYEEDGADPQHAAFGAHLAGCDACRDELAALQTARQTLTHWIPPESRPVLVPRQPPQRRSLAAWLGAVPGWAQVAAAMLVLGVSAGLANLEIRYSADGLTIRTGWMAAAATETAAETAAAPTAPWQADLAALASALRGELAAVGAAAAVPAAAAGAGDVARTVRAAVDASERRQKNELALRVGEIVREFQIQRQADLEKIDRNLSLTQTSTAKEVYRQRELINLMMRVSQR
jgi:hypothetical protein